MAVFSPRACGACVRRAAAGTGPRRARVLVARPTHSGGGAHRTTVPPPSAASGAPSEPGDGEEAPPPKKETESKAVGGALVALRFYKAVISPLLPPACRFLPTCSEYAQEAYSRYGLWKGTVLTAWRLVRCSPLGASGYDPAVWPPVALWETGAGKPR